MLKNDYMKEVENSLMIVKREVDKNIVNNEFEKAFEAVNKQIKGLIGLDITTIDSLSFESVKGMISRENQYNAEKYVALGELLILEGSIWGKVRDESKKIFYYKKSLQAFAQGYEEDESIETRYFNDTIEVIDELRQYELAADDNKRVFLMYEITSQFDKAEDILFYMLKKSNKASEIIKLGLDFYNRLKEKSEDELEKGKLPLEEIEDGILQLMKQ